MYNFVTKENLVNAKPPKRTNVVDFSCFKELYHKLPFNNFSIKYVVEGCEKYTVNGRNYHVMPGQYLLANQFSEGTIEIDSKKIVKGVCINLSSDLLSEAVGSLIRPDTPIADPNLDSFFCSPDFLENQYDSAHTNTGPLLKALGAQLMQNPQRQHQFSKEFYLDIAGRLVADHRPICKQLQSVGSMKSETKKDLIRKLNKGKEYMDAYFSQAMDIATVAKESNLSEFHFFRLFKAANGVTPYQYILQKRLQFAASVIGKGQASISDAAFASGFTDIFSFSKAFKNYYGLPPSKYFKYLPSEMNTAEEFLQNA